MAVQSPASSVRFRLRAATGDLHAETERLFALPDRLGSREAYVALLAALYGFYEPAERALGAIDWRGAIDPSARLVKTRWIARDLAALGVAPAAVAALPRSAALPPLDGMLEGLGALYVLEGATLGGQVIRRALDERLALAPQAGGRFFAGYGEASGAMWRGFVAALDAAGAAPQNAAVIENAACAMFEAFGRWLPPAPVAAALKTHD